jgi:hypothetical protein
MLQLFIGFSFFQWDDFSHYFHLRKSSCHDLIFGLATKAKAWQGVGQECNLGSHLHYQKCERMNPHTPKWTPTLGVGIFMDLEIFQKNGFGRKKWVTNSHLGQ